MSTILKSLPVGERVGIAFSGGLVTDDSQPRCHGQMDKYERTGDNNVQYFVNFYPSNRGRAGIRGTQDPLQTADWKCARQNQESSIYMHAHTVR